MKKLPAEGPEAITGRARPWKLTSAIPASSAIPWRWMSLILVLDPVEDFLVNRKKGHCEYFSSALALLLRSIDIPSRVVNGFKGGDWNNLTQSMYVARSTRIAGSRLTWERTSGVVPLWITLDATPVADRDESVAQVGGVPTGLRPMTDMVRYVWVFYILGYDSARQNRLLYTPIRLTHSRRPPRLCPALGLDQASLRPPLQVSEP